MKVGDKLKIRLIKCAGFEHYLDYPVLGKWDVVVDGISVADDCPDLKMPKGEILYYNKDSFEVLEINGKVQKGVKKLGKDPVNEILKTEAFEMAADENMKLLEKVHELRIHLDGAELLSPINVIDYAIDKVIELKNTNTFLNKEVAGVKGDFAPDKKTIADLLGTKYFNIDTRP